MHGFPHRREFQSERRAFPGRGADVNFSSVFFDDAVADGKAQAGAAAAGFGGEKWIEDAVQIFARNPDAGVGDFDFHVAIAEQLCALRAFRLAASRRARS